VTAEGPGEVVGPTLKPIWRAARAIWRVLPFRYDAFQPHPTGVVEDGLTVVEFQMLVEPDADGGLGQDRRERCLADYERIAPQVVPVQLDQIKSVEEHRAVIPAISDTIERRDAALVTCHRLTVDNTGPRPEPRQGLHDQRKAVG
jgi:hypothetical protein